MAALAVAASGALGAGSTSASGDAASGDLVAERLAEGPVVATGAGLDRADALARRREPRPMEVERPVRVSRGAPRPDPDAWRLPIAPGSYRLTSAFGECSALWSACHTGLDFAAASGTPVVAVARGVVTETSYAGAYGNRTIVALPDGTEVWYCHQAWFTVGAGELVTAGQEIGAVGTTGNTTGAHLHLEVRPAGGDAVDPSAAFAAHGVRP